MAYVYVVCGCIVGEYGMEWNCDPSNNGERDLHFYTVVSVYNGLGMKKQSL